MTDRPNLLIAATIVDATAVKREFGQFSSWHVMTPRNTAERGWLYADYVWTPKAQNLPAQTRWDLRQRLIPATDEDSNEEDFPSQVLAW
jgi:hypothetical protein